MTIIGRGDLSPPRRNRPSGRYVTVALVVILLGGGGFAAYKGLKTNTGTTPSAKFPLCKKGSGQLPTPKPLRTPKTTIVVDNATLTTGLASDVATDLRARKFHIASVGNTAVRGHGVATVRYSSDRAAVAALLAAQIKGAKLVPAGGSKRIELDVGPKYRELQSRHAAAAAFHANYVTALAGVSQSPSPSPTATPSPTCRPRSVQSTRG